MRQNRGNDLYIPAGAVLEAFYPAHYANEDGIVKVSGLSPDYVYKSYEDAWGRLGYIYEDDDAQYSVGDNVENPFVFRNTPKKVVFDEATVRNVFKKKEKTSSTTTE